jgi:hypothetical protein
MSTIIATSGEFEDDERKDSPSPGKPTAPKDSPEQSEMISHEKMISHEISHRMGRLVNYLTEDSFGSLIGSAS